MNHPSDPLPLLPAELLRRYSCAEPTDTRFRAIARLRQSLWREQHGYACGRYLDANGRTRRLGSRVSRRVGRTGVNLVDLTLIPLVRHEIAYREVGAVIHVERLWTNLLASQALTFNLFGPFKQRPALATAVMRRLVPDLVGEVTDVRFEHSPGRGHPGLTADYTAFDVLIRCTTPHGRHAFVAIEMKYSEAPAGIAAPERPRYDTLSRSAGVFRDADAPALRHAPIEQFWREQLLVTAMLERGHYHDGRLLVIAPALKRRVPGGHRTVSRRTGVGRSRRDALPGGNPRGSHSRRRCRGRRHHRGRGDRALPRLRAGPSCPGRHLPAGRGHRLSRQPRHAPTQCQPIPRPGRGRYLAADRTRPCGQDRHRLGLCDLGLGCPGPRSGLALEASRRAWTIEPGGRP
jgi:hypothetical protein